MRLDHPDTYLRECDSCHADVDELDVTDGPDGIELCRACCLCVGCGKRLADERLTADEGEAYCAPCAGGLVVFALGAA